MMEKTELRAIRCSLGLTQEELGDKLGCSRRYLGNLERGVRPIETMTALAVLYLKSQGIQRKEQNEESEGLDFLAKQMLAALSKNITDTEYLAAKKADFEQLDRLAVARKIATLDANNQATLAELLGVELADLCAFLRVLAKL